MVNVNVWKVWTIGVVCIGTFSWQSVQAFFGDDERGAVNQILAATLDITVKNVTQIVATALESGSAVEGSAYVRNDGSLNAMYSIDIVGATEVACNALTFTAYSGGVTRYSGALAGATIGGNSIDAQTDATWQFSVVPQQGAVNGTCTFDIVFDAQQQSTAQGFRDEERITANSVTVENSVPLVAPTVSDIRLPDATVLQCGDAAWVRDGSIDVQWSSIDGASGYDYAITAPDGSVREGSQGPTTMTSIVLGIEGLWSFRVRATASDDTSPWSALCTFHVDTTPPVPTGPVGVNFTEPPQTPGSANGVTFDFVASEPTASVVYFDKNPADFFNPATYTYRSPDASVAPNYTTQQSILAVFPTPGTYIYIIEMRDRAGNVTVSPPGVFNVPSLPAIDVVTLNEIVANPEGSDSAPMPGGEWVELYNRGSLPVDVAGWKIRDATGRAWTIGADNSDADGDYGDSGETVIPPQSYLVVYRNGASMTLNNSSSEEVSLYSASGALMDQHTFSLDGMPVGKSVARFPDGVGVWIDPETTPGDRNALATHERDALRRDVLERCFGNTDTHIVRTEGTVCDPIFVAYIGMIADTEHRELTIPGLLEEREVDNQEKKIEQDGGVNMTESEGEGEPIQEVSSDADGERVVPAVADNGATSDTQESVTESMVGEMTSDDLGGEKVHDSDGDIFDDSSGSGSDSIVDSGDAQGGAHSGESKYEQSIKGSDDTTGVIENVDVTELPSDDEDTNQIVVQEDLAREDNEDVSVQGDEDVQSESDDAPRGADVQREKVAQDPLEGAGNIAQEDDIIHEEVLAEQEGNGMEEQGEEGSAEGGQIKENSDAKEEEFVTVSERERSSERDVSSEKLENTEDRDVAIDDAEDGVSVNITEISEHADTIENTKETP